MQQQRLEDWLYPSNLSWSCQLLQRENCYPLVGILQELIWPLTNIYSLDLGAIEVQQTNPSSYLQVGRWFQINFWVTDVMGDSIDAEKAKLKLEHSQDSIQFSCYSYQFFDLLCATPLLLSLLILTVDQQKIKPTSENSI